jgi:hypothetical protein
MRNLKILLTLLTLFSITSCNYMNNKEIKGARIMDKERVTSISDGSYHSYYLVYTNKGEFTIKDEFFRGNFKSSSWYGVLQREKCYNFKVGGYRNGFFTMYPNIHSKPVECKCEDL